MPRRSSACRDVCSNACRVTTPTSWLIEAPYDCSSATDRRRPPPASANTEALSLPVVTGPGAVCPDASGVGLSTVGRVSEEPASATAAATTTMMAMWEV